MITWLSAVREGLFGPKARPKRSPDQKIGAGAPIDTAVVTGPDQKLAIRPAAQSGLATEAAGAAVGGPCGAVLSALDKVRSLASRTQRETREDYLRSIQAASKAFDDDPGVVQLRPDVPTVLVPDIHARRDFLLKVLDLKVEGDTVAERLAQGRANLVCLGDGMHSERRARERWQLADRLAYDYQDEQAASVLDDEMLESLGTMKMVMDLKVAFPDSFHFLRGDHEEVRENCAKYARKVGETELTRRWMESRFGEGFLDRWAAFEDTLPLMALGRGFVASHSFASRSLSRREIEKKRPEAAEALNFTNNVLLTREGRPILGPDGRLVWETPEHLEVARKNLETLGVAPDSLWFAGHRHVFDDEHGGLYRSHFEDQLVQINSEDSLVVAVVPAGRKFEPGTDILRL